MRPARGTGRRVPTTTAHRISYGPLRDARAIIFDLDGVLTPTTDVHRRAWRQLFEPLLHDLGARPYTDRDYFRYIDGKPRYEGVSALLNSRCILRPLGAPDDPPDAPTVCGLGNRKSRIFQQILRDEGVSAYPGALRMLDALAGHPAPLAVVSSSRNTIPVLRAAGIRDRFALVLDGAEAARRNLPGKPDPATFAFAAQRLGTLPRHTAVIEDAAAGVRAAAAGGFFPVIGVDRGAGAEDLARLGADAVVGDLGELLTRQPAGASGSRPRSPHGREGLATRAEEESR